MKGKHSVRSQNKCVNIIAVDPGASGGLALYATGKVSAEVLNCDTICTYVSVLRETYDANIVAYMEQVQGYIGGDGAPGSSMFNFGNGYGYLRGLFDMASIPLRLVPPQKWMRAVAPGVIGMEYGERKRALKALAQSWYPEIEVTLKLADALGLLRYANATEASGAVLVDIPARSDFPSDKKRAKAWCKSRGWPMPSTSSELIDMVNYWRGLGRPA